MIIDLTMTTEIINLGKVVTLIQIAMFFQTLFVPKLKQQNPAVSELKAQKKRHKIRKRLCIFL